ncbi:MAG: site-2 protease family protein [Clostridia bacterium]|nr:site-2 protease family protein [Clostridia bacterium]
MDFIGILQKVWPFVVAILLFCIIIFVHEFAHFLSAKACGVKVNEFSIGMGPKLIQFGKKETKYTLRLFPIGGYCAMEGEDEASDDERAFVNAPKYKRFIIIAAGALMNIFTGFVIITILLSTDSLIGTKTIANFSEDAVSNRYLQVGDEIVSINNMKIISEYDIHIGLMRDDDGIVDFVVKRDGEKKVLNGVEFKTEESDEAYGNNKLLIQYDFFIVGEKPGFFNTIAAGAAQTVSFARLVFISLYDLCTGQVGFSELSGPIGTVKAVAQSTSYGFKNLMFIIAFISINIGVFNLLPIPALDGGRLFILLIQAITRDKIKIKHEALINTIGLVVLLIFIAVVSANDIWNIIKGT